MAGLGDLAAGLRLAGGTVSQPVFNQIGQENEQMRALAQRAQELGLQREMQRERMNADNAVRQQGQALELFKFQEGIKAKFEEGRQRQIERMAELDARNASTAERAAADRSFREWQTRFAAESREGLARMAAALRQTGMGPQPQLVTNQDGVFQIDRSGRATQVTTPEGVPLSGKQTPEKALPGAQARGLIENHQNLRRAETALALVEGGKAGEMTGDTQATGWKGFMPDTVLQRMDPQGVPTRAAISDLGSLIIHERSGAAVTAAESPRLRPFIPQVTDDPETAKTKLKRFVQVYKEMVEDQKSFYKESGYKVPDFPSATQEPAKPSIDDLVNKYAR